MNNVANDERISVLAALLTFAVVAAKTTLQVIKARKENKAA